MSSEITRHKGGAMMQQSERKLSPVEQLMSARKDQLADVLPEHVSPERFVRVITNAALRNTELHNADPVSLFSAAMQCAQDGLMPDNREAFLSTFRNSRSGKTEVTYIPMIAGVIKRILQSGEISNLGATLVHENDEFDYYYQNGVEHTLHRPMLRGDRGPVVGVYAFAASKDGAVFFEFMTVEEVNNIRSTSRQAENKWGPWVQHWGQMAKKTVIHRLSRRLPMSAESMRLLERDHALYDFDEPQPVTVRPAAQHALPSAHEALEALESIEPAEEAEAAPEASADVVEADENEPPTMVF